MNKQKKHFLNLLKKPNDKIGLTDISIFMRQFSTLFSAGIPLLKCCEILSKSQKKVSLQKIILHIKQELLTGKQLYLAMSNYPHYFNEFTCQLIRIGEHTGKLHNILILLADHQEKRVLLQSKIKQAIFYPCIILAASFIILLSMFIFVIPRFAELFQNLNQFALPFITRSIFYLAKQSKLYVISINIFLLFNAMIFYFNKKIKSIFIKYTKEYFLNFPSLKKYLIKLSITYFARNLALTLQAGLPIIEALHLTGKACSHIETRNHIFKLKYHLNTGMQLYQALQIQVQGQFPLLMINMIKIGEESGTLSTMLNHVADFLENEIDIATQRLSQMLEPLIMLGLGVLIGGIVIAIYLPIFNLGNAL